MTFLFARKPKVCNNHLRPDKSGPSRESGQIGASVNEKPYALISFCNFFAFSTNSCSSFQISASSGNLIATRANQLKVGDMNGCFAFNTSTLFLWRCTSYVFDNHVNTFDDSPVFCWNYMQNGTRFAFIFATQNIHLIACFDM